MDLIIPWIISAVCIVFFYCVHVGLGMLGWPICCLVFLFACVAREKMRKSEHEHQAEAAENKMHYSNEPELMQQLGIQFNGSYYTYKGYDYDKLEHAVSHARYDHSTAKNF